MLPFSQVAIFDPQLVQDHYPDLPLEEQIGQWKAIAMAKGANAAYLRNFDAWKDSISVLRDPAWILLLPNSLQSSCKANDYWHFSWREREQFDPRSGISAGLSCHSDEQLRYAGDHGFAYAFLSPVFSTLTHPVRPALGLQSFAQSCAQAPLPVIALGGMDAERGQRCREAGAAGFAAIRYFFSFTET